MLFNELILEAERSGYLLGSHSAREGEKVRGMPRQSTIADIGFYNRDPEEDIKHPTTPTPAAVKATFTNIGDVFKKLIGNKEAKDQFVEIVTPYIEEWNVVKNSIPRLNDLLQRKASLEKTLRIAKPTSEDKLIAMLERVNNDIKELTQTMEKSAEFIKTNETSILDKLMYVILDIADDRAKLKNATDRYFAAIAHRKLESENMGGMSYLTISPIISLVRFYNNTLNQLEAVKSAEVTKAIKTHRSGKNVMQQLSADPAAQPLIDLYNLVKLNAPKLRDDPSYKTTSEYVASKQKAHQLALDLKPRLPELIFQSILVNLNRFFNAQEGSEGALMNVLLNTAPKAILHGES